MAHLQFAQLLQLSFGLAEVHVRAANLALFSRFLLHDLNLLPAWHKDNASGTENVLPPSWPCAAAGHLHFSFIVALL
jgi:hypothetical protein